MTTVFKYLKGCHKEEGEQLFSLEEKARKETVVLNCGKIDLDQTSQENNELLITVKIMSQQNGLPRDAVVSLSGHQTATGSRGGYNEELIQKQRLQKVPSASLTLVMSRSRHKHDKCQLAKTDKDLLYFPTGRSHQRKSEAGAKLNWTG